MNKVNEQAYSQAGITVIDYPDSFTGKLETNDYTVFIKSLSNSLADKKVSAVIISINNDSLLFGRDDEVGGLEYLNIYSDLVDLFVAIDAADKLVVASIKSTAVNVAFELALRCHFIVGAADAKVGFSSVEKGLIPGLGGTQFLPRKIGVEAALNMIHRSTVSEASEFEELGLFDAVIKDDVSGATLAFTAKQLNENSALPKLSAVKINLPNAYAFFDIARMQVGGLHKGNKAAGMCVDALEGAVVKSLSKGLKNEQKLFHMLMLAYNERTIKNLSSGEQK